MVKVTAILCKWHQMLKLYNSQKQFLFHKQPQKGMLLKNREKYCFQPSFPQSQKWILVSLILSVYPRVFIASFEQAWLNTRFLLHKIKESFVYLPIFSRLLVALETTCNSHIIILILIIKQRKFSKENLIVRESHSLL